MANRETSTERATREPDSRAEVDPDVAQLLGLRPAGADSMPTSDELDGMGSITDTRIYEGELEARPPDSDQPDDPAEQLESLVARELRDGETDDPNEAAEEGLTWIPPTDPPTTADERGDAVVAAGFATSADDEPFDADHHAASLYPQDEMEARVLDALRASAETTALVDALEIDAEGGRVTVAGTVDDLTDEDAVIAVAQSVTGVAEVVSRIEVRAVDETAAEAPRPGA